MNNVEKHEAVREHLTQHPEQSDRQIAGLVGVSPTFVGKVRRYLEEKGKLTKVETRKGQDGRRRGRRRRRILKEVHQARLRAELERVEAEYKEKIQQWHEQVKRWGEQMNRTKPEDRPPLKEMRKELRKNRFPAELEAERDQLLKELERCSDTLE
jgi:hypothetical protein